MTKHEHEDDHAAEEELDADAYEEDFGMRSGVGLVVGLVLGALLGAGVTLLMAPERGEVTRRRIAQRAHALKEDARDHVEEWADDARRQLRRQRRRLRKRIEH